MISGISDYAQQELMDIVYIELPKPGQKFEAGESFGLIESVKAAVDLYMPMTGEIVAVNEDLVDVPEAVNKDPYLTGWLIVFKTSSPSEWDRLLSTDEYFKLTETNGG